MFKPIKIRQYLAFMKSRGHSADAVLHGTGVDEVMLELPDFLMDIPQSKTIVTNMIDLTGNPGIGFEIGTQTRYMDLGLVGYLLMSARTVGEAVHYWGTYCNGLVGMMLRLNMEKYAGGEWAQVFHETAPLGVILNFYVEEQMSMIQKLGSELVALPLTIKSVELSYPPPPHYLRYCEQFKCPIKFNASSTRMKIVSPQLDYPLHSNAADFKEMCAQQCAFLSRQINQQSPVVSKIKDIFMGSCGHFPDIETAARKLNVSARTLRRYLYEEGYNYRKVANEYRAEMAKEYLQKPQLATKEIAQMVGFQDTESFRRAFKIWTGMTINEYRSKAIESHPRSGNNAAMAP